MGEINEDGEERMGGGGGGEDAVGGGEGAGGGGLGIPSAEMVTGELYESVSAELGVSEEEGEEEISAVGKCVGVFRNALFPSKDEEERERVQWGADWHHWLQLSAFQLGLPTGSVLTVAIASNGGAAFFMAYLLVHALLGLPFTALFVLLGQFSGLNTARIYRFLVPIGAGIGWASIVAAFVKLIFLVPILAEIITTLGIICFGNPDTFFSCRSLYDKQMGEHASTAGAKASLDSVYCFDHDTRSRCSRLNGSRTALLKTRYRPPDEKLHCQNKTEKVLELIPLLDKCLAQPPDYFHHFSARLVPTFSDLIPKHAGCAFAWRLQTSILNKTRWFHQTYGLYGQTFFLAHKSCSSRFGWELWNGVLDRTTLRIQLFPDRSITRIYSPLFIATRLHLFLQERGYTFQEIWKDYCSAGAYSSEWDCLVESLDVREVMPLPQTAAYHSSGETDGRTLLSLALYMGAWLLVLVPSLKGPAWLSRRGVTNCRPDPSWVPITAAYLHLVITGLHITTFQGAWHGIKKGWEPQWCRLLDPATWIHAIFTNLVCSPVGIGTGVIPVISSYSSFHQEGLLHAISVSAVHFSLGVAWFTIFSACIGAIGYYNGLELREFNDQSMFTLSSLSMVELEKVYSTGWVLPTLVMLLSLMWGLGQAWSMLEAVVCLFHDEFRYLAKRRSPRRSLIAVATGTLCFGLGVLTGKASDWADAMDMGLVTIELSTLLLTSLVVLFCYVLNRVSTDVGRMLGAEPRPPMSSRLWNSPLRYYFLWAWAGLGLWVFPLFLWYLLVDRLRVGDGFLTNDELHRNQTLYPNSSWRRTQKAKTYLDYAVKGLYAFIILVFAAWKLAHHFFKNTKSNLKDKQEPRAITDLAVPAKRWNAHRGAQRTLLLRETGTGSMTASGVSAKASPLADWRVKWPRPIPRLRRRRLTLPDQTPLVPSAVSTSALPTSATSSTNINPTISSSLKAPPSSGVSGRKAKIGLNQS